MWFPPQWVRKIETLYQAVLQFDKDLTTSENHPVNLVYLFHYARDSKIRTHRIVCRCMVEGVSGDYCPDRKRAREMIRDELRREHGAWWRTMSPEEVVHDLWSMHQRGHHIGERVDGLLYVEDVATFIDGGLIKVPSERIDDVVTGYTQVPSQKVQSAIVALRKKKVLDVHGVMLVPHKEMFRFPDEIHNQFAYWIEEPLGWPNGEAGSVFMETLYTQIAQQTGWKSGDEVFGEENMPNLTPEALDRYERAWLPSINTRLAHPEHPDKASILTEVTIEFWIIWLSYIKREREKARECPADEEASPS